MIFLIYSLSSIHCVDLRVHKKKQDADHFFCLDSLERVQIPDEQFLDVFVCNVHSTDNICVNLSGENYSVSLTSAAKLHDFVVIIRGIIS